VLACLERGPGVSILGSMGPFPPPTHFLLHVFEKRVGTPRGWRIAEAVGETRVGAGAGEREGEGRRRSQLGFGKRPSSKKQDGTWTDQESFLVGGGGVSHSQRVPRV
jgi:hypothetical protein